MESDRVLEFIKLVKGPSALPFHDPEDCSKLIMEEIFMRGACERFSQLLRSLVIKRRG
jgi:hypothetical protein